MKRTSLFFALLCAISVSANKLVTEDFSYEIGTDLVQCGWKTSYSSTLASGITITNGLEFAGYEGCGVGNAAVIDCETSSAQPHLHFAEVTLGNVYVALMFQPSVNYKDGYFLYLRDDFQQDGYAFNMNARVFLTEDYKLALTFADNSKKVVADNVLDPQKVYLLVLKYSIVEGANNDSVSLYLLTSFAKDEPAQPLIGPLADSNKADINPANVGLRGYDANGFLVVDGIRVGTSWADAVVYSNLECGKTALPTTVSTKSKGSASKVLVNGQILILQNGRYFSLLGEEVKR